MKIFKLANNLKVIFIQNKNIKHISIQLKAKAGSNYEKYNEIGVAHLLEHLMVNKHYDMLINYGAKVNAYTTRDVSVFEVKILKEYLNQALEYIITTLLDNSYAQTQIETQKNIIKHEIKLFKNDNQKILTQSTYKNLFPNCRMKFLNTGNIEQLNKIGLKEVINFKKNHYVANNMVVCITGNLSQKQIENINTNYFNFIKSRGYVSEPNILPCPNTKVNVIKNNNNKFHLKIDYQGKTLKDKNKYGLFVLSHLLNQQLNYLFKNKKSLLYQINSQNYFSHNFGIFSIYAVVNSEKIINSIFKQIKNINLYDLYKSKIHIISDLIFKYENNHVISDFYTDQNLLLNPITFEQEVNAYKDVTLDDVKDSYSYIFNQNPKITILE